MFSYGPLLLALFAVAPVRLTSGEPDLEVDQLTETITWLTSTTTVTNNWETFTPYAMAHDPANVTAQAPAASILSAALKTFPTSHGTAQVPAATIDPATLAASSTSHIPRQAPAVTMEVDLPCCGNPQITTQQPAVSVLSEALMTFPGYVTPAPSPTATCRPCVVSSVDPVTSSKPTTVTSESKPAPEKPKTTSAPEEPKPTPPPEEPKAPPPEEPKSTDPREVVCYFWDNIFWYVYEISPIAGFSQDGAALHKELEGCGALTHYDFGTWSNGTKSIVFDIDLMLIYGCVERAIHSAGGPPNPFLTRCRRMGEFNGSFMMEDGYYIPGKEEPHWKRATLDYDA